MTLLEQLAAKMKQQADTINLAVVFAFVRRLTILLLGKQPDFRFAKMVVDRLRETLRLDGKDPIRSHTACTRQVDILEDCLYNIKGIPYAKSSASHSDLRGRCVLSDAPARELLYSELYANNLDPGSISQLIPTAKSRGEELIFLLDTLSPLDLNFADLDEETLDQLYTWFVFVIFRKSVSKLQLGQHLKLFCLCLVRSRLRRTKSILFYCVCISSLLVIFRTC
jgi:hypothetical protein